MSTDGSRRRTDKSTSDRSRKRTPNPVRRAISRQAVLDAARSLFVTRGYLATSVEDIASRAQLSKGGLYFHFRDKSQLLGELLRQSAAIYAGIIGTLNNTQMDPRDRLAHWVNEVSRLGADEPELILLPILVSIEFLGKNDEIELQVTQHYTAVHKGLTTALRHGRTSGVFQSDAPLREAAACLTALADGALLEWLRRKRQLDGAAFVRTLRSFVFAAVAAPPSRRL
ncbi:MAG: helix-turn-helix domain-containing protein [Rhodospirillales bacterium]